MSRVLARRDDNWKKLQQYVVEERETFQLVGPGGGALYGFAREYLWFPRDGRFIKSPVTADGVAIGEDERRREELRWLAREERRAKRLADKPNENSTRSSITIGPRGVSVEMESAMREALEPGCVAAGSFLRFRVDSRQEEGVGH